MTEFPRIEPGQRALVAGRTGSGKSTLACWLLKRSPGHWVILNPKLTKAYSGLPESGVVTGLDLGKIEKSLKKNRFVIVNPKTIESNAQTMDSFILDLHETFENLGFCADELYTLHTGGRAGEGLLGWLTRGRELKQSFLGLTQRPAWLSQFLFSESEYIGTMSLNLEADRKRMADMTGYELLREKMPDFYWYWYAQKSDTITYYQPVPRRD